MAFSLTICMTAAYAAQNSGIDNVDLSGAKMQTMAAKYTSKKGHYFFLVKNQKKNVKLKGNTLIVKGRKCKVK